MSLFNKRIQNLYDTKLKQTTLSGFLYWITLYNTVHYGTLALRETSEKKTYLNMVCVYFFPLIVILVNNLQYFKTRFLLFSVQPTIWVPH